MALRRHDGPFVEQLLPHEGEIERCLLAAAGYDDAADAIVSAAQASPDSVLFF